MNRRQSNGLKLQNSILQQKRHVKWKEKSTNTFEVNNGNDDDDENNNNTQKNMLQIIIECNGGKQLRIAFWSTYQFTSLTRLNFWHQNILWPDWNWDKHHMN